MNQAVEQVQRSLEPDVKATAEAAPPRAPAPSRHQSSEIMELAGALAKAQAQIRNAEKDAENPHFRSSYATLASVWDACRGPLSSNGLAVTQITQLHHTVPLLLETRLMHSSGQWMSSFYPVMPTKNDPQGLGSALTYARRYSLAALVGVAPDDDDDGEAASGGGQQQYSRQQTNKAAKQQASKKTKDVPGAAEMAAALDVINKAPDAEALRGRVAEVQAFTEKLDETQQEAVRGAYKRRMDSFDRGAQQRAAIRANMPKDE